MPELERLFKANQEYARSFKDRKLPASPLIPKEIRVHGFVYHVENESLGKTL